MSDLESVSEEAQKSIAALTRAVRSHDFFTIPSGFKYEVLEPAETVDQFSRRIARHGARPSDLNHRGAR